MYNLKKHMKTNMYLSNTLHEKVKLVILHVNLPYLPYNSLHFYLLPPSSPEVIIINLMFYYSFIQNFVTLSHIQYLPFRIFNICVWVIWYSFTTCF